MGIEYQGTTKPTPLPEAARVQILDHFESLQWRIVRQNGSCFGISFPEPRLSSWSEDFVVCFREGIYMLSHAGDDVGIILTAINAALQPTDVEVVWSDDV